MQIELARGDAAASALLYAEAAEKYLASSHLLGVGRRG